MKSLHVMNEKKWEYFCALFYCWKGNNLARLKHQSNRSSLYSNSFSFQKILHQNKFIFYCQIYQILTRVRRLQSSLEIKIMEAGKSFMRCDFLETKLQKFRKDEKNDFVMKTFCSRKRLYFPAYVPYASFFKLIEIQHDFTCKREKNNLCKTKKL